MANVNDIYGTSGSFLNAKIASDEKLFRKTLTITGEEVMEFNKRDKNGNPKLNDKGEEVKESKLILDLEETDYRMVINKTNAFILSDLYGPESEDWVGKQIQILKTKTSFGDSIQVDDEFKGEDNPESSLFKKKTLKQLANDYDAIDTAIQNITKQGFDVEPLGVLEELKSMEKSGDLFSGELQRYEKLLTA